MNSPATRDGSIEAGAIAGVTGLIVFLALHHVWIVPIWFIAPVGLVMAATGGAAVGAAYVELLPHLPPRPSTTFALLAVVVTILAPSMIVAELRGPTYSIGSDGAGSLLVSASEAVAAFSSGSLSLRQ